MATKLVPAFDKKVRKLPNGDVVFPCSCAIVVKEVSNIDTQASTVGLKLTVILRIKITGYEDNEDVTEFLREKLKWRINEVEKPIKTDDALKPKCNWSSEKKKGQGKEDLYAFTLRVEEVGSVSDD